MNYCSRNRRLSIKTYSTFPLKEREKKSDPVVLGETKQVYVSNYTLDMSESALCKSRKSLKIHTGEKPSVDFNQHL